MRLVEVGIVASVIGMVTALGVMIAEPSKPRQCIQEVHQGLTTSRELGTLSRDAESGLIVCSRRTY